MFESQYCIINVSFMKSGGEKCRENISMLVKEKDFNRINKEISRNIEDGSISCIDDFYDYVSNLIDLNIFCHEIGKFYLHEISV